MTSLAKPKRVDVKGSDGKLYKFLAKKDDLRKDGRLIDFDAILNKLLMADSESRRRHLSMFSDCYGLHHVTQQLFHVRNTHIQCRLPKRRMWIDPMGAQHTPHPQHNRSALDKPACWRPCECLSC